MRYIRSSRRCTRPKASPIPVVRKYQILHNTYHLNSWFSYGTLPSSPEGGGIWQLSHCKMIPPAPTQNISKVKTSKIWNLSCCYGPPKASFCRFGFQTIGKSNDYRRPQRQDRRQDRSENPRTWHSKQQRMFSTRERDAPHHNCLHWARHRRWERKHFHAKRLDPERRELESVSLPRN